MTVDVKLSNFMSPDRGPRTAALAPGYAVQDLVLHRGDRAIGITHAHHPQSRALIVFCGGDQFRRSIEGGEALEVLARDADVILFDYPDTATARVHCQPRRSSKLRLRCTTTHQRSRLPQARSGALRVFHRRDGRSAGRKLARQRRRRTRIDSAERGELGSAAHPLVCEASCHTASRAISRVRQCNHRTQPLSGRDAGAGRREGSAGACVTFSGHPQSASSARCESGDRRVPGRFAWCDSARRRVPHGPA